MPPLRPTIAGIVEQQILPVSFLTLRKFFILLNSKVNLTHEISYTGVGKSRFTVLYWKVIQ